MNERITLLAEQAGIFKPKEFYQHIDALQLEKFAGLIVKECADLVQKYMSRFPEDHELTKQIKEHFGVK